MVFLKPRAGVRRIFPVHKSRRTLRMSLVTVVVAIAALAIVTQIGVFAIQKLYPPDGRFIDVAGARLHVVELGPQTSTELPVVLIHGASANLNAMREPLGALLAQRRRVILIDRPGHGWSTRTDLRASTPAIQAQMIDEALGKMGVPRAIIVGHSWAGALAAAFALNHPARVGGLVLLSPVTHPWPGGIAWYNTLAALPVVGPLFAHTLALPVGLSMMSPGARAVFLPQSMPEGYVGDTAIALLMRPREFLTNAWDMVTLKDAVRAQAPGYGAITAPTVIITGDADATVSPDIHSRAFVAAVPGAKLIVLPGVGHLPQNAAPERIVAAIDSITQTAASLTAPDKSTAAPL
jgi:pimeloyl-ACP methyl ester carboxylesterase